MTSLEMNKTRKIVFEVLAI